MPMFVTRVTLEHGRSMTIFVTNVIHLCAATAAIRKWTTSSPFYPNRPPQSANRQPHRPLQQIRPPLPGAGLRRSLRRRSTFYIQRLTHPPMRDISTLSIGAVRLPRISE